MKFEKFEEIVGWQKAEQLSVEIYRLFKECRDFDFKRQIQRAVVSIMNNIAEGFERRTNREFVQFLFIAKGSCGEVRSMLHLAEKLGFVSAGDYQNLSDAASEISKILFGLIKVLQNATP